ncbi:integrase, catalytic region, zinc finger, CCHC-type containing protein [Tanacetum coccineum]
MFRMMLETYREIFEPRLQEQLQMFNAIIAVRKNDFLFVDASWMEEIKELSANICLMARIQPANFDSDAGPSYDFAFLSEESQSQFIHDRDVIRDLEQQRDKLELSVVELKRQMVGLQKTQSILKCKMSENEDKYHGTVLDLEAKAKKNEDLVLKIGNSLQGMFMLRPKPMSFYDSKEKHGLGYTNPYTLRKAISQNLKLYDASCLDDSKIHVNVRDTEDILDDTTNNFVPQKKFSAEQKYFSSSFISSENSSNACSPSSSSETKPTVAPMPSANPMKLDLNKMENEFQKLVTKQQKTNTKRAKSVLPSTGLSAPSSVIRPLNRDSPLKNSVLSNTKKSSKKVEVSVRTNKKTYVASKNVVSNKKIVIDMDIKNALKAKDVLYVSCDKNVLIPCHDKCLANYKLNVYSKVRRALFTTHRTVKSKFEDTTPVVSKTRFIVKTTQSKSLDTTLVVSKTKIDAVTPLSAKNKIVDSGCSKHITGDRSLLENFIEKFIGTACFGNDHFIAITGYGDYVQGNITVSHVYYVEGLRHNLFSVRQFCDGDLEVAFRSNTCYVPNMKGDNLLTGAHEFNLYTISISDMVASSPVCLMAKATSTKSWLWHHKLSHLNFGTINDLTKHDLVDGLPKFKYGKDHLCSACERGKRKKVSHPPKVVPCNHSKLEMLHMDLCGPMWVALINGKRYILVIVDDYSRFTWVYFLCTKDETPEIIKNFIARVQLNYNVKVHKIRTDNGTEFKNATLKAYYEKLGIIQQFSIARTPQQNGVVERRNRTLVEAVCTMLIFSRLS